MAPLTPEFAWTRPLSEEDTPTSPVDALEDFADNPWFGGGQVSVDPVSGGKLPSDQGTLPPGADGPTSDRPTVPAPATDIVGEWGLPAQGEPAVLSAADHVSSHATAKDAEAGALQAPGATVILPVDSETGGFSVFVLSASSGEAFVRANVETLAGESNVYASAGVHAFVTTDGFLLDSDTVFDENTADLWEGVGADALGEDPIPVFERAMASTMEMLLAAARAGAEEQAHQRDSSEAVPVAEEILELNGEIRELERHRRVLLTPIREPGQPGSSPPSNENQRKAEAIEQQIIALRAKRTSVTHTFPLLQSVDDLEAFIAASDEGRDEMLGQAAATVHRAIHNVELGLYRGDIDLFALAPLVLGTLALMGIGEDQPVYAQLTDEMRDRQEQKEYQAWLLVVFQLGGAVAGFVFSGGMAAAAIIVGASAGLLDAKWMTEDYLLEQNLAQLGSGDPESALIDPSTLGMRGFFVALAWLGLGLDAIDVFKAVKGIRGLFGKQARLEAAVRALAKELKKDPDELLKAMRAAQGLKATEEHLGVLRAQLGIDIAFDDGLGGGARLHFTGGDWTPDSLRVGREAELFDILAHKLVIDSCRQYDGLSGRLLKATDYLGGEGPNVFPPGSAEWAAKAEIEKLNVVIDNLHVRAASAIDADLAADLERQAAFLESRAAHYEQVVAGLIAEGDPRFIARMTEQTQEAYDLGFDKFEAFDLEAIDPSRYWYVKNPAAPPPYTVYHAQGTTPRLELVADAGSDSGYSLAKATQKAEHVFAAGTTKQEALDFITQRGKSFAPYREMLLEYDIATDDAILKAMVDPAGATEETVRHLLKGHFHGSVLGRMFVAPGGDALDAAESVDAYHGITRNLNSADGGKLGEEWYDRYSELFNGERLEKHPSYRDSTGGRRLPDFIRRGGKIEGNTAIEVKSTTKGLSKDHDLPQITEMLKLAERKGSVDVGGRPVKISSGKVVFTHESGARGSMNALEDLFGEFRRVFVVEVVFADGPKSFSNSEDLKAALGA